MTVRVADNIRVRTPECNISAGKSQDLISTEKWCPKDLHWKPRSEFYANKKCKDGLDCWCKECRKKVTKQWQRDNRKRYSELVNRGRTQEKDTEYKARHRSKHRDRHYARYQLQRAREKGLKLNFCSWPNCTETEKIEGHHSSYKKPHEIVSLCFLHHRATDLLGDKLGFDLPTIDISIYFKRGKRVKLREGRELEVGVLA